MNYANLAELGVKLRDSNATTSTTSRAVSSPVTGQRSERRSVLDDFVGSSKTHVRDMKGVTRSRVIDRSTRSQEQRKKVVDSVSAEDLISMPRTARRKYLGGLSPKERSRMLGEMHKIKDSRRVADAIEGLDGNENKSQLINLATLIGNISKDDNEFNRKLLADCLETLPNKYTDYTYHILDGDETELSDGEIEEIEGELDEIRTAFNIEDSKKRSKKKVSDSVLDDVVEQPAVAQDIDALLAGVGEFLKTGNIDKLSEVRQALVGGGVTTTEDEEEEPTDEETTIQEDTDALFGDGEGTEDGEGVEEGNGDDSDLFGGDATEEEIPEGDTGDSDLFGDEENEEKEDVGFENEVEVIEVPEGVDENVKNLVQELLDIFSENYDKGIEDTRMQRILARTRKMITDGIDGSESETEDEVVDFSEYSLSDYPAFETTEELVRVPLSYQDYTSLSNADVRENDIKSLMPTYSVCTSTIEPCNSRCVKVTSEDGVVSYWTPICGSVDTEKVSTMTCDDLKSGYVPVDAFCGYASKLNQLDLISPLFYKEAVESPMWCVAEDCEQFGLKAGEKIIPDSEGEVKIFDRCYKKVE